MTRLILIHNGHAAVYDGREQKAIFETPNINHEDVAVLINFKESP